MAGASSPTGFSLATRRGAYRPPVHPLLSSWENASDVGGAPDHTATLWAETAIEAACRRAEQWYRGLPQFEKRVNLGSVVGFKHPALVSEHDCVVHFARFLNETGVAWEAMHHQVSVSRWLFGDEHPAATVATDQPRWRVDIAILGEEEFRTAELPAPRGSSFRFDALLEFAYLTDYWQQEKAHRWGAPEKGIAKVKNDVEKIARYLEGGACRSGYVIVFEECAWGFPSTFALDAELDSGCRVRFVRGYPRACSRCNLEAALPIVWGMPGPELEQLESEGKVVLGGCLVDDDGGDPQWACARCGHRWRG